MASLVAGQAVIAEELGFTKAAIHHHFRTSEQLLAAVLEPILEELRSVVEAAESKRTAHARAEHMLSGYAALAGAAGPTGSAVAGDALLEHLVDAGRRTLGSRAPRRVT